jgi:Cys-rich four helix bundle protein (predicted Tat secretion target)
MDRRKFIQSSVVAGAGLVAVNKASAEHHNHKHHGKNVKLETTLTNSEKEMVLKSVMDCIRTGHVCQAHCARLLAEGDVSMADCNASAINMMAACDGLVRIVTMNNLSKKSMKSFLKACGQICRECEKICEKHAKHHAECKACMDSCKACATHCEKLS